MPGSSRCEAAEAPFVFFVLVRACVRPGRGPAWARASCCFVRGRNETRDGPGRGAQEWEKSLGAQPVQHAMSILGIARHVAGGGAALTVKDQADLVEQGVDGRTAFLGRADAVDDERLLEDLADGVAGVEGFRGILEDHLQVPADGLEFFPAERRQIRALEADAARGGREQAHDGFPEGRFAAAGLADESERFTGEELEAHAVHGLAGRDGPQPDAAPHGEMGLQVADFENGRGRTHTAAGDTGLNSGSSRQRRQLTAWPSATVSSGGGARAQRASA